MKSHIEILHQPTVDTSLCLVLHYENARYLFNCGEGTQRSLVENKVRLSNKVKDIFISRVDWDSLGGLPGMLMTVADAGSKNVTVHGGPNTTHVLTGMRNFMMRKDLSVSVDEYPRDRAAHSTFQDQNINLQAICVLPDHFNQLSPVAGVKRSRDGTPSRDHQQRTDILKSMFGYDAEHPLAEEVPSTDPLEAEAAQSAANGVLSINSNKQEAIPARKAATLPDTKPFPAAYSYICRGPARPGKFFVEKAKALGLKPGPAFGELQRGSAVTLDDGTVIHPHQCLGPGRDGAVFLIIDCPSVDYISNLISSTAFSQMDSDEPVLVIHNVGKHVFRDTRYQDWMQKFRSAQHLVANSEHCANSIVFRSAAHNLTMLSKLDAELFKTPVHTNQPEAKLDLSSALNAVPVETGMIFHLEPDRWLAQPLTSAFSTDEPSKPASEYLTMVNRIKSDTIMSEGSPIASAYDNVTITTLGTGSSSPSKYRNVSSTLVEIPNTGALLLDTGEGTMGQLRRRFGSEADDKLRSIKMIFISHMHADHHLGLFRVLQQWSKANAANDSELFVLGPHFLERWMTEYAQAEDIGLSRMAFIDNRALYFARQHIPPELIPALDSLDLKELKTTDVIHCPWAFALKIKHKSGFSLAYSGDTRPSNKFIAMGQNVSLLIHEATLENDMAEEAVKKRHCTTAEAIQVGLSMKAKHVLLTHFSQRYPKVPILTSIPTNSTCKDIGVSFDLMSIRYSELYKLPKYVEAFKLLYQEEEASDDGVDEAPVVKAKAQATNGKIKPPKTRKQKNL